MRRAACLALAFAAVFRGSAQADPVEDFYRGKTITMIVGTGENAGTVEAYPRALTQVIKKYLPGAPNMVVINMPGAGGIKAANYISSIAPQDGTVWGFITRGFISAPLLKIPQANFDSNRLNWIGSPSRTVSVGVVWKASTPVRTIQDAMTTQVVVGATSAGQDTAIWPAMLNRFAGTQFKIVTGYSSVGQVDFGIEKGELQGKIGFTWAALNSGRQLQWLQNGLVEVLVQLGAKKSPAIPPSVPLALDLARAPEDRLAMQVITGPAATGFPSFMGPGVPRERVEAVRAAFMKALVDPDFIDIVKRQGLDIDPIPGADIERIVRDMHALPAEAIELARSVLPQQ